MTRPLTNFQMRDAEALLHPYTDAVALRQTGALVIERGEGVRVFDQSGRGYIDGLAGLWCCGLGFGNAELVEAARLQMEKLPYYHLFAARSHEPGVELAEKIKELAPGRMARVFYQSSGSEANDTQVKLAWYMNNALGRPAKKKIISRIKGYHGVTIVAASLTGLPNNHRDFDLPIEVVRHTATPHFWKGAEDGESERDFSARLADELEDLIVAEGPDTVAAFIAEPVMGAGGVIVPPEGYFEAIGAVLAQARRPRHLRRGDLPASAAPANGSAPRRSASPRTPSRSPSSSPPASCRSRPWRSTKAWPRRSRPTPAGSAPSATATPTAATRSPAPSGSRRSRSTSASDMPARVRAIAPRFAAHLDRLAGHPLVGEARASRADGRARARAASLEGRLRPAGQGRRPRRAGADGARRHLPRHRRHPRLLPADDDHRGRDRRDVRARRGGARRHGGLGEGRGTSRLSEAAPPAGAHPATNPLRGIGLKVLAVLLFVGMAVCIKASAPHVPPGERVFFRSFFAIPVILAWLAWTGDLRHGLDTLYPMGHLWRGLVGTSAMGLGFTALGLLPLPEATALGYAAPLLVVIFAAMFLGEQVRIFRLSAVAIGLVGVMIVLWPRLTVDLGGRRRPRGARRDGGAARRGLRRARPGLRPQAHQHRGDLGDRLLLLADRDPALARHPAVRLGGARRRARRCSWSPPACSAASARSC